MDVKMMPVHVHIGSRKGAGNLIDRSTGLAVAILALILVSCGDPTSGEPSPGPEPTADSELKWPEGACLLAGEMPIFTRDVERLAAWIALFDPGKVPNASKRAALSTVLLELAAVANEFREPRSIALEAASTRLEELLEAPESATDFLVAEGGWSELGLVTWGEARSATLNQWNGPFEDVGRLLLMRPTSERRELLPGADEFTIQVIEFPYVPPDFDLEGLKAITEATPLEVIDPEIGDLVPAMWRYRMRAER